MPSVPVLALVAAWRAEADYADDSIPEAAYRAVMADTIATLGDAVFEWCCGFTTEQHWSPDDFASYSEDGGATAALVLARAHAAVGS